MYHYSREKIQLFCYSDVIERNLAKPLMNQIHSIFLKLFVIDYTLNIAEILGSVVNKQSGFTCECR